MAWRNKLRQLSKAAESLWRTQKPLSAENRQREEWEMIWTVCLMDLRTCGHDIKPGATVVSGDGPYAGLPVDRVIECYRDRPEPAEANERLMRLWDELAQERKGEA